MIQTALRLELSTYLSRNPDTANAEVLEALIAGDGDLFARGESLAHVTASAWILNEERTHALLIEHAKYRKFCPPGGHVDAGETTLQACVREVGEEVGLALLRLLMHRIFDVDIHRIPANEKKREPAHWHIDVRYAFQASNEEQVRLNLEECLSHKWQPLIELEKLEDPSISRLAKKSKPFALPRTLAELGYSQAQMAVIRDAMKKPQGLVVIAGTSGSEPSVTQKILLSEFAAEGRAKTENQASYAQEQSENYQDSAPPQTPSGDFKEVIRLALRRDPDHVLLPEIRDEESAKLASSLTMSGHQVLSKIHAKDAISIATRLRCLGLRPDELSEKGFLGALIYQVRLPLVCQDCALTYEQELNDPTLEVHYQELKERISRLGKADLHHKLRFRNLNGCKNCNDGAVGFTCAAEVITPDDHMRQCFQDNRESDALLHYRKNGGKVALEHALEKAFCGEVDLRDVEMRIDQLVYLDELDAASRQNLNEPG